jgi:hypothetical protein
VLARRTKLGKRRSKTLNALLAPFAVCRLVPATSSLFLDGFEATPSKFSAEMKAGKMQHLSETEIVVMTTDLFDHIRSAFVKTKQDFTLSTLVSAVHSFGPFSLLSCDAFFRGTAEGVSVTASLAVFDSTQGASATAESKNEGKGDGKAAPAKAFISRSPATAGAKTASPKAASLKLASPKNAKTASPKPAAPKRASPKTAATAGPKSGSPAQSGGKSS